MKAIGVKIDQKMKKKLRLIMVALVMCLFGTTSCLYKETSDVDITFAIASSDSNYEGPEDLATVAAGLSRELATVLDSFDAAFSATGLEPLGSHHWVMREQTSDKKAEKIAADSPAYFIISLPEIREYPYTSLCRADIPVRSCGLRRPRLLMRP